MGRTTSLLVVSKSLIILILFFSQACTNETFLPLSCDLNIENKTGEKIFITPIGIDSRKEKYLLVVLKEKKGKTYFSKKCKDFEVGNSEKIKITFDYDDIQFSGIILVSDHKSLKKIVITKDILKPGCCSPPIQELYTITKDMFKEDDRYIPLFEEFEIP